MPGDASITVDGLGFGHGRGLSQYGALARGRAGQDYREIVDFYYPGTTWATAAGSVRVLVSGDTTPDVVVDPRTGLTVRAVAGGRPVDAAGEARRAPGHPLADRAGRRRAQLGRRAHPQLGALAPAGAATRSSPPTAGR